MQFLSVVTDDNFINLCCLLDDLILCTYGSDKMDVVTLIPMILIGEMFRPSYYTNLNFHSAQYSLAWLQIENTWHLMQKIVIKVKEKFSKLTNGPICIQSSITKFTVISAGLQLPAINHWAHPISSKSLDYK